MHISSQTTSNVFFLKINRKSLFFHNEESKNQQTISESLYSKNSVDSLKQMLQLDFNTNNSEQSQ